MEMEKEEITLDEARQTIIDLFVEEIKEGISSKRDREIAKIVQDFPGLCGIGTMRILRSKALKIVEEINEKQDIRNKIKNAS